jgi:calcineurin-like phosphoesterase family protein
MAVYFISDLHLGHKNILKFADGKHRDWGCETVEEHDAELIKRINSVVHKRDKLYILGDVVFRRENLWKLGEIQGQKHIILGNHDSEYFNFRDYEPYVIKLGGLEKYKSHWLSHAPVHPAELRDCPSVHGHVHHNSIADNNDPTGWDKRYINVCVESLDGYPIAFEEIRNGEYWNKKIT